MSRFLIACGGTGGHLAPGIAIAEILRDGGHDCLLLVSEKKIDSVIVEKYSRLEFYRMSGRPFTGGLKSTMIAIGNLVLSYAKARSLLRERKPDAVLLFGGFLSVGLGLAAYVAGVPIILHEANGKPGRATRLLKRLATRVYLPDGVKLNGIEAGKIRHCGYPVRKDIRHITKVEARRRLGLEVGNKDKLLVVIGGSQGAESLNDWANENFKELAAIGISLYCVTGHGAISEGKIEHTNENGETIGATFVRFSDRMGDVLSAADLVVSRAGAGSIAEIIRCRVPSILIPYPYAANDHQQANALAHEKHGAGTVVFQEDLDRLIDEVKRLAFDDRSLDKLKANLKRLDRPESAKLIAEELEKICMEHSVENSSLKA